MTATSIDQIPLPRGVAHSAYVNDMREVAAYDVHSDEWVMRYDWFEDGQRKMYTPPPISAHELALDIALEVARRSCAHYRGTPQ